MKTVIWVGNDVWLRDKKTLFGFKIRPLFSIGYRTIIIRKILSGYEISNYIWERDILIIIRTATSL